ncbi:MAG: hypothetical protein GY940_08990, partial [bacterium]|nr:hypothetical protein [bacterium]
MKRLKLLLILPLLSCILLAFHFSRLPDYWFALSCLLFPLVLLSRKRWVLRVFQLFPAAMALIWLKSSFSLLPLLIIVAPLVLEIKEIREMFDRGQPEGVKPAVFACLVTAGLLVIIQLKVKSRAMLLMDRFMPGSGIIEILLLVLYAGWIAEKIIDPGKTALIRRRIWTLFSAVFFTQLSIGILGIDKLLMTGKLH